MRLLAMKEQPVALQLFQHLPPDSKNVNEDAKNVYEKYGIRVKHVYECDGVPEEEKDAINVCYERTGDLCVQQVFQASSLSPGKTRTQILALRADLGTS